MLWVLIRIASKTYGDSNENPQHMFLWSTHNILFYGVPTIRFLWSAHNIRFYGVPTTYVFMEYPQHVFYGVPTTCFLWSTHNTFFMEYPQHVFYGVPTTYVFTEYPQHVFYGVPTTYVFMENCWGDSNTRLICSTVDQLFQPVSVGRASYQFISERYFNPDAERNILLR